MKILFYRSFFVLFVYLLKKILETFENDTISQTTTLVGLNLFISKSLVILRVCTGKYNFQIFSLYREFCDTIVGETLPTWFVMKGGIIILENAIFSKIKDKVPLS